MSPKKLAIIKDESALMILSAIVALDKEAYGINIQTYILREFAVYLPLEPLYEVLIDLIEEGRITSEKIGYETMHGWRKLFLIVLPEGMTLYNKETPGFPDVPIDWNSGKVVVYDGTILDEPLWPPVMGESEWTFHNNRLDSNVLGYFSMFERGV